MKSRTAPKRASRPYVQGARAEAALDTGRRIIGAFIDRLMTQWFDEITLDRVAADAEVTVQTVVRRFGGKEGLLAEAVKVLATQITARRATGSADLRRMVENLVEDYEHTGDPVIRLLALEPRHPALADCLDTGRRYHREWAASLLGAHAGMPAPRQSERALDALVAVTDVYSWKLLRRDMGRSKSAVVATIETLVRATIAGFSAPHVNGVES